MSKRNFKSGFTLVELLVTISIFVILTGVVLFNQSKFNGTILLTNLAYDTALTIRQAQNYGINVKEFNDSNQYAYGVHFATSSTKSFILFADIGPNQTGIFTGDTDTCLASDGCVNRYSIKRGNYIDGLYISDDLDNKKESLDIIFRRPNPEAKILVNGSSPEQNKAIIVLGNPDGSTRRVIVQANGLIEIKND